MRLNKRSLAQKLGVSERALLNWQREGMPVLEHGRRGQENSYDLRAVVTWIKATGRGMTPAPGRRPVDIAALELELGMAAPQRADVCTGLDARTIARAIALARLTWAEDLENWDWDIPPHDMADLVDVFIHELAQQFAAVGFENVGRILDASASEAAWPHDIEEIIARCRADIPPNMAAR